MTSIFLVRDDQVLLLYRRGSRAVPDSWVGVGGHVEPDESTDPTAAAVRELQEEIGVAPTDLHDLALRYVSLRDTGDEIRNTYFFTATLSDDAERPEHCEEGDLRWFAMEAIPSDLDMRPTAQAAFRHWLAIGRHDAAVRLVVMAADHDAARVVEP